jgi:hypothetical protein
VADEQNGVPQEVAPVKAVKIVHYRNRDTAAPTCNPNLKGVEGHIMARAWKDLFGEDGAALDADGKRACLDCLRIKAERETPTPKPEVVQEQAPAETGPMKEAARAVLPGLVNVVLFKRKTAPLSYIRVDPIGDGEALLGNFSDSVIDCLDHYGLLGEVMDSPLPAAIVSGLVLVSAVRGLPTFDTIEELRRAHGMAPND